MVRMRAVFTGVMVSAAAVVTVLGSGPNARVTEEVLGEISPGIDPADVSPVVSNDGLRIAWEERQGKRSTLRLNGVLEGTAHDEIAAIRFSPTGARVAYAAKDGKGWRFIVDGAASPVYEMVGTLRFSADGRRMAYSAKTDGKWVVVVDGVAGRPYDEVGAPIFSPDGQRVLHPAKRNKKWVVVENGEERGPERTEIWRGDYQIGGQLFNNVRIGATRIVGAWARFAPDEQRYVYFVGVKDGWAPVLSGTEPGPGFAIVDWPVFFGAQFARVAYAGARVSKPFAGGEKATGQVVIDGVAGPPSEGEATEQAGAGLAKSFFGQPQTVLQRGVLLGGVNAGLHGVSGPTVSPDREHIAYVSRRGANDVVVVRDGAVGPRLDRISCGPRFTASGVMAYAGVLGDALVLMADDERRLAFSWEGADCERFAVEGEHIVLAASDGHGLYRVFKDGRQVAEHAATRLGSLRLSSEGETLHVAYEVRQGAPDGTASSCVVLDGTQGRTYDEILEEVLQVSPEGKVTYVARRGRQFVRVTQVPET